MCPHPTLRSIDGVFFIFTPQLFNSSQSTFRYMILLDFILSFHPHWVQLISLSMEWILYFFYILLSYSATTCELSMPFFLKAVFALTPVWLEHSTCIIMALDISNISSFPSLCILLLCMHYIFVSVYYFIFYYLFWW